MCTKDGVTSGSQSDICLGFKFGKSQVRIRRAAILTGFWRLSLARHFLTVEAFLTGSAMSEVDMSP